MELLQAEHMAKDLISLHLDGWVLKWNRGIRNLGKCKHGSKTIELSKNFVVCNNEETVRAVVLHEIAHALSPRCDGHRGKKFKEICATLGAPSTRHVDAVAPKHKWTATCPSCGEVWYLNVWSPRSCGICSKEFNTKYLLQWQKNY